MVDTYIDNSGNHTHTNTYYRDSPMSGRSPVKNIVFSRRTLHSKKKKWCLCGKQLVFFKDAECWSCTECGHTEYIEQPKQQIQQQGIGGIASVDGLSDTQTRPNRGASKFRSIKDPRSRFLKKKPEIDDELARILEQGATLVSYKERIEEDGQTLSSDELRANK
jgi:hypothetical protein